MALTWSGFASPRQRIRKRSGVELAVDEQAPHLLEGDRADELLDVDAAVAQRRALLVGLGDLGGEGDDAFQAALYLTHLKLRSVSRCACARWRRTLFTLPHARMEHHRRRPPGERS